MQNRTTANLLSWRALYLTTSILPLVAPEADAAAENPKSFVGFIGAHRYPDNSSKDHSGAVEVICAISPEYWSNGYATEAITGYFANDLARLTNYEYTFAALSPKNLKALEVVKGLESFGAKEWDKGFLAEKTPSHLNRKEILYRIEKEDILKALNPVQ
ncbi:MAG: GNAT family N-acetyltransferase [Alphaproteobacteria bacterium]